MPKQNFPSNQAFTHQYLNLEIEILREKIYVLNYSSLSNIRVGFNKSILDENYKNINVLPVYLKYFPVLVLQKHVLLNG